MEQNNHCFPKTGKYSAGPFTLLSKFNLHNNLGSGNNPILKLRNLKPHIVK